MNYDEYYTNEKPLIIIEEKPDYVPGQPDGEKPVIVIEHSRMADDDRPQPRRRWFMLAGAALATLLCVMMAVTGLWKYRTYINIGVPVSVTSKQNIAKLAQNPARERPEVIMTTDSILGVGLNFYEIRGLKAEISFKQPDTTDTEVYLYSRSADFTSYDPATNHFIGSLVQNGVEFEADVSRLGYCAMAGDNVVIGIARDEDVKDYCIEQGGSFFRQFILVSNGVLPTRFFLHGKVERRALGRIGDRLYLIESHGKEALWAFADAIREYGFIDAIYITGGTDYSFYRDADGRLHDIGNTANKTHKHKGQGIVPWLVFKKR